MSRWQGLFGLLALAQLVNLAAADVYIMTSAYILDPLPDIPADFGPDIPDSGIDGILRSADPEDACSPFTFTDFDTPWIALIARQQQLHPNNCTFDIKVWNAQNAGAMAAIVYDDVYESLIIMSKPKGHPDPSIPSVFVSQKAGIIMRKLMTIDTIRVKITPLSTVAWLSMLMSAFLGVLALGVVLATFYVMRSWSLWLTGMHVRGGGGGGAGGPGGGQAVQGGQQHGGARPTGQQDLGLPAESLRLLPVLGSLFRATAAMGAAVWGLEGEGEEEEMRPLLAFEEGEGEGDVEAGCGGRRYGGLGLPGGEGWEEEEEAEEEEEEYHDVVSRSSSESGCWATAAPGAGAAATAAHTPRPPGAHAGETKRVCAICLESYVEGDKHPHHQRCGLPAAAVAAVVVGSPVEPLMSGATANAIAAAAALAPAGDVEAPGPSRPLADHLEGRDGGGGSSAVAAAVPIAVPGRSVPLGAAAPALPRGVVSGAEGAAVAVAAEGAVAVAGEQQQQRQGGPVGAGELEAATEAAAGGAAGANAARVRAAAAAAGGPPGVLRWPGAAAAGGVTPQYPSTL
ncbi:hypothetical protein VOLCADRAFT_99416 [Volvox carteri f. nagariensis]|uniref:PA domain-containing protein n=1 Tax=Volvox carteri f. nagariensis TaxID=3068 RepID=D8UHR3_VOLCA|nr:uncharacterized protein VOLCADRAFT_99416 [Volvox carteri f. nagariensis]EFJ40724.1 hypothetical protein VOLCADRAFT_99416 [Volvox carteri f. nagariensis]|eukprot:XP_002958190.1 hypothetical protein VOLCADRAFT_99416 [Volvox carteri f. nagariensis]